MENIIIILRIVMNNWEVSAGRGWDRKDQIRCHEAEQNYFSGSVFAIQSSNVCVGDQGEFGKTLGVWITIITTLLGGCRARKPG